MNSTAEKLSKAFAVEKCPPVCQEVRATLVDCYKQNPQKPLLCSETVKKFSQCVRSTRMVNQFKLFTSNFLTIYSICTLLLSGFWIRRQAKDDEIVVVEF